MKIHNTTVLGKSIEIDGFSILLCEVVRLFGTGR